MSEQPQPQIYNVKVTEDKTRHIAISGDFERETILVRGTIVLDNDLTYKWTAYDRRHDRRSTSYRVFCPGWRKRKDVEQIRDAIAFALSLHWSEATGFRVVSSNIPNQ